MKPALLHLGHGQFAKYHALGNDYLVVDGERFGLLNRARIVEMCDRHRGVGADGVLVRVPSDVACVGLRIYNPDGSQAEKSGNGLRIFARCLFDLGYLTQRAFAIETPAGVVHAALDVHHGVVGAIEIAMGQARFDSTSVHLRGPLREVVGETVRLAGGEVSVTAVSIGNPHCVVFVDSLDVAALRRLGPSLENHTDFTERTNVQLVRVASRQVLEILIWERGVGETSASGSSSCAAAAAAKRAGLIDDDVEVRMPGGSLQVHLDASYHARLRGPATPICRGVLLSVPATQTL